MNTSKSFKPLTCEQESALAMRIQHGDIAARNELFVANMPFVVSEAYKFSHYGLAVEDLIAEGNIAMLHAAEKYIPGKAKFITYASFWIHQAFTRAIHENRIIHIPENQIKFAASFPSASVSLDAECSCNEDDGYALYSRLADDTIVDPEEEFTKEEFKNEIEGVIDAALDKRSAAIVRMSFGFNGRDKMNNADIGRFFNMGRENVRQILCRACGKLHDYIINNNLEIAA